MSPRSRSRSISGPIILSSVAVVLTTALLVGWILVIYRNQVLTQNWEGNTWLMVAGIISFVAIMTVLVLFSVFLAREILEVRRHTSFIDSVTHELRSPLASLRLCLQTMARPQLRPEQREQLREMMLDDVERLSAFIDDILESNRLGQGPEARRLEAVELAPLVMRCVATVAKRHHLEPTVVEVDVSDDIMVYSDPVALEVIVRNLLDNAVKYSDPPYRVGVRAFRALKGLVIEVHDEGVGIPRHALKRVFERFYRVDEEAVRERRGTGLGLFVVAALVRGLGGRLRALSEGSGKGTCMRIELREPRSTDIQLATSAEEAAS